MVCCCPFWHHRTLLFWRKWSHCSRQLCSLHRNDNKLFGARTEPKKNKLCQCVVSKSWCHSAHCKRVNDYCSKHVSRAPHFPFRRRAVAPSLSRSFNVWFFFLWGYWKSRVYTHKPPLRWMIWRKPSVRKFVRSIVSRWPVSWTILKKRLEKYIQEDGRHLTNIIFKT